LSKKFHAVNADSADSE